MTAETIDYQGPVKIYGQDSVLLTTGAANLAIEPTSGRWHGVVSFLKGTAVAGKALVVSIEIPGQGKARGQLTPDYESGEYATSLISGFGTPPFAAADDQDG